MAQPKITVLFYTTYGMNHTIAQTAAEAAEAAGAQVRLRRVRETVPQEIIDGQEGWKTQLEKMQDIPEAAPEDMEWADGYFVTAPTRYGVVASQLRAFIDTLGPLWQAGKLANTTFTAATTANTSHGGQETTLQSLYVTAMHWGSIIVAPGYADPVKFEDNGNPYGFSMKAGDFTDLDRRSVSYQATRLVEMTKKLIA